jgi:hypothetical protein
MMPAMKSFTLSTPRTTESHRGEVKRFARSAFILALCFSAVLGVLCVKPSFWVRTCAG